MFQIKMPQEVRILSCVKCKTFQGDIVKKAKKWRCKICSQMQSIREEFFRGSGAECRKKVQELNLAVSTEKHKVENELIDLLENDDLDFELIEQAERAESINTGTPLESKWTKLLEESKQSQLESIGVQQVKSLKTKNSCKSDGIHENTNKKNARIDKYQF